MTEFCAQGFVKSLFGAHKNRFVWGEGIEMVVAPRKLT